MTDGKFSWSAWDPNRWDHHHHAGVQVNAYRVCPFPFAVERGGWGRALLNLLFDCIGVRHA
jgi:hypothetical protein